MSARSDNSESAPSNSASSSEFDSFAHKIRSLLEETSTGKSLQSLKQGLQKLLDHAAASEVRGKASERFAEAESSADSTNAEQSLRENDSSSITTSKSSDSTEISNENDDMNKSAGTASETTSANSTNIPDASADKLPDDESEQEPAAAENGTPDVFADFVLPPGPKEVTLRWMSADLLSIDRERLLRENHIHAKKLEAEKQRKTEEGRATSDGGDKDLKGKNEKEGEGDENEGGNKDGEQNELDARNNANSDFSGLFGRSIFTFGWCADVEPAGAAPSSLSAVPEGGPNNGIEGSSVLIHASVIRRLALESINLMEKFEKNPLPTASMVLLVDEAKEAELKDGEGIQEQMILEGGLLVGIINFDKLQWEEMIEPFQFLLETFNSEDAYNEARKYYGSYALFDTNVSARWWCTYAMLDLNSPGCANRLIIPLLESYWGKIESPVRYAGDDFAIAWFQAVENNGKSPEIPGCLGQLIAGIVPRLADTEYVKLKPNMREQLIDSLIGLMEVLVKFGGAECWCVPPFFRYSRREGAITLPILQLVPSKFNDGSQPGPTRFAVLNTHDWFREFVSSFLQAQPAREARLLDIVVNVLHLWRQSPDEGGPVTSPMLKEIGDIFDCTSVLRMRESSCWKNFKKDSWERLEHVVGEELCEKDVIRRIEDRWARCVKEQKGDEINRALERIREKRNQWLCLQAICQNKSVDIAKQLLEGSRE